MLSLAGTEKNSGDANLGQMMILAFAVGANGHSLTTVKGPIVQATNRAL
jgi:hypothetical protein